MPLLSSILAGFNRVLITPTTTQIFPTILPRRRAILGDRTGRNPFLANCSFFPISRIVAIKATILILLFVPLLHPRFILNHPLPFSTLSGGRRPRSACGTVFWLGSRSTSGRFAGGSVGGSAGGRYSGSLGGDLCGRLDRNRKTLGGSEVGLARQVSCRL